MVYIKSFEQDDLYSLIHTVDSYIRSAITDICKTHYRPNDVVNTLGKLEELRTAIIHDNYENKIHTEA